MGESQYYSRQTHLKEISNDGQILLKNSRVLIVGAGGLGHPVATYLAASGVGHINILDFDSVEESNLNRQIFFTLQDIGASKSKVLKDKIQIQNPYINVACSNMKIDSSNAMDIISKYDLVLDCCDNFATKFLLHDCCWLLKKKLVQSSIYQFEGQVQVFDFDNHSDGTCLRCLWDDTPGADCVQNCSLAGVVGATAGVFGTIAAMEAIKLITNIGTNLHSKTLIFDLLSMEQQKVSWKKNSECKLCSKKREDLSLSEFDYTPLSQFELKHLDLNYVVVDLRDESEIIKTDLFSKYNYLHLALSSKIDEIRSLDRDDKYTFICSKGIRSLKLVKELRKLGFINSYSLSGGVEELLVARC